MSRLRSLMRMIIMVKKPLRRFMIIWSAKARRAKNMICVWQALSLRIHWSDNGAVTRGVCVVDENDYLAEVVETGGLMMTPEGTIAHEENGSDMVITPDQHVSMNMWGFTPNFLNELETGFSAFLSEIPEGEVKREYLLPTIVDELIKSGKASVKVLETQDKWFGVTYKEDKESVVAAFRKLIADGVYPANLWG